MENQATSKPRISTIILAMLAAMPPSKIVWRTMSGNVSAGEMHKMLSERDTSALQWVAEHLRVMTHVFKVIADEGGADALAAAVSVDKEAFVRLLTEMPGASPSEVMFRSSQTGQVTRAELVMSLTVDDDLAARYVAGFIYRFASFLNAKDEPEE